jgi:hypothetical protein
MEDKELLKKLNNLKDITLDSTWKNNYRDILYSQISANQSVEVKSNFRIIFEAVDPGQILIKLAKPVWSISLAGVLILIVGAASVYASKNSLPGDSLYIAKIISEKAQLMMAFNEKDKAKLGVEFATNRAKEMMQVLNDTGQSSEVNSDKLKTLSQNFKKEISQVKDRLTTIKKEADNQDSKDDESTVFGAGAGKNNQRMEIAEPVRTVKPTIGENKATDINPVLNIVLPTSTSTAPTANRTDKMLEEVEKLVEEKNINGAINKLGEVGQAIGQTAKDGQTGQVKGESETATSTK